MIVVKLQNQFPLIQAHQFSIKLNIKKFKPFESIEQIEQIRVFFLKKKSY